MVSVYLMVKPRVKARKLAVYDLTCMLECSCSSKCMLHTNADKEGSACSSVKLGKKVNLEEHVVLLIRAVDAFNDLLFSRP